MATFQVNKGIGRTVEFKGLKAQYLYIFVFGLVAIFFVFIILYIVGISKLICFSVGAIGAALLVWQTFALNAKYGEYGLMKLQARKYRPRYIISRKRISKLIKVKG